ncbi:MAG: hypothetical protein AB7R55_15645 [Gemmatimonadales bacterium]
MTEPDDFTPEVEARTAAVAVIRRAAFEVTAMEVPDLWDPSSESLAVGWTIRDPGRRIRRGRVVYTVLDANGDQVEALVVPLTEGELAAGSHRLPEARQWDGTLPESFGRPEGSRATAELAPFVRVEVWNTDENAPEAGDGVHRDGLARPTTRAWELCAVRGRVATIDCISSARWARETCIPYPEEETLFGEERNLGQVSLRIEVKNVAPGASASIQVYRIVDPDDRSRDRPYLSGGGTGQPGLENLTVRNGRVVQSNGHMPFVRFVEYGEHWVLPGRNYYCFRVSFGFGPMVDASSRDFVGDPDACLRMLFTVFVHHPDRRLTDSLQESEDVAAAIRRQDDFRVFFQGPGRPDFEALYQSYRHRYIVVFSSHGSSGCAHAEHPRLIRRPTPDDPNPDDPGPRLRLLGEGFDPDQDWCPPPNATGRADLDRMERRLQSRDRTRYADVQHYGWCQQRGWVIQRLNLGEAGDARGAISLIGMGRIFADAEIPGVQINRGSDWRYLGRDEAPRLAFMADACQSVLTPDLGHAFHRSGTRFFHGWHYSCADDVGLLRAFFDRWLQAPQGGVAADPERFVADYQAVAAHPYRDRYHPRVMEDGVVHTPGAAPDAAARALE